MSKTVGIVMGSKSDLPVMEAAGQVLDELGVSWEMRILSAHRTPEQAHEFAVTARDRGLKLIIAGAGMAAHLAGVMAGVSELPVIGVPLGASLGGFDSLLATVQMPPGVPVATVAVGKAGAKNAAWMAVRILALSDEDLRQRHLAARAAMTAKVLEADASIQ
ncbi:MAG: 5-(carboxyamino)imidazole ribonucleotide mutase [Proteobacteria bacterium]|nr:5-(carboxyamino)imidazole ribonucleotide mutase [Pseudomonadota bacterium]MCP4916930.1 5-(carboxyamino)imidazole ribonucleotide mutase [Pseudomonadota bacterium]